MKNISQCIFEAGGKPSDMKKYKRTAHDKTVHFKSGDIYDFSDPGYDDKFTYYTGEGQGYIKDKEGNVYDVYGGYSTGDAGRIAGGSTSYHVCIKKANGKDDFNVYGYIALFSRGSNTGCVEDIKRGYYLEDYIAKYYNEYDHGAKFKELAEKGNKDAKPYEQERAEKKASKEAEFVKRYIRLPENGIHFEINDSGFNILSWHPGSSDELDAKKKEYDETDYWIDDENGKSIKNPEINKLKAEVEDLQKKADNIITAKLKDILTNELSKVFKTKDINSLKGIAGTFVVPNKYEYFSKSAKTGGYATLAIDSKTKNVVSVTFDFYKVIDNNLELKLADNIDINKKFMSPQMEKLFRAVANAWKKANKGKQGEYVKNNWYRIQREGGGYWSYNIKNGEAKQKAALEYQQLMKSMDFDSNEKLTFSLALVQQYVEGDMDPELGPVENPLQDPEPQPKKERGKDTKMSATANKAAYDKMTAWHEGKRNQNLKNCSDAKLKMNYKVCKELGYDKECGLIEDEAKKRGLVLESITLKEYVQFINESINDED